MLFLSLLMDMLLMLGGGGAYASADAVFQVPGEHRTHGHLPGPPNDHLGDNTTHIHHGTHGHSVGPTDNGNHAVPPHSPTG